MSVLEEPAARVTRRRRWRAHGARAQLALLGLIVLSVGIAAITRWVRATGPSRVLDDVSIALAVVSMLGLLGLPAALRRGRRHRAGIDDIDEMSGEEFEHLLAALFEDLGEKVQHTGRRGDFGADLVTDRGGVRTVVQAKRYDGTVGIEAVQQAIGARGYYEAHRARVVTNSVLTPAALALAQAGDVEVVERDVLVSLLARRPGWEPGRVSWAVCRQVLDGALLVAYVGWLACRLAWQVLRGGVRTARSVLGGP